MAATGSIVRARFSQSLLFCLVGAAPGLTLLAGETPSRPGNLQRVSAKSLVVQLGDPNFDTRAQAMEKLRRQGEAARKSLEAAAQSPDPEIAHCAMVLLKAINRASIVVKVLGPDGKPLPGQALTLLLMPQTGNRFRRIRRQFSSKTDREGLARIEEEFNPGAYYLNFRCDAAGCLPANEGHSNQQLKVGPNRYTLQCRRGGSLKGTLLAKDKSPLKHCRILLAHKNYLQYLKKRPKTFLRILARQRSVQTDEHGAFRFTCLRKAGYFLAVVKEDKLLFSSPPKEIVGDEELDLGSLVTPMEPGAFEKEDVAGEEQGK